MPRSLAALFAATLVAGTVFATTLTAARAAPAALHGAVRPPTPQEGPSGPVAAPVDPLARVAIAGASATAGFNLYSELGRAAGLADFVRLALAEDGAEVLDASDTTLFMSPLRQGAAVFEAAAAFAPTATVAVDLPFWFVHGPYRGDAERRAAFEWFLGALDAELGTVVLGTIPTMGPEVAEWMVPARLKAADATVAWANERLRAVVAERDDLVLVPLAEFLAELREGEDLALRGQTFDGDDVEAFLQDDGLHPTVIGTAALAILALDGLDRHLGGALAERVDWDIEELAWAVEDADGE